MNGTACKWRCVQLGAFSLLAFHSSLWSGFARVHERTCALFHACEAVSAAVLRRGKDVGDMADSQIKSRERVRAHGEVFTAEREVKAMCDLVKEETERIDARFLEPACGDGNFLAEILHRKLAVCGKRYGGSVSDWEKFSFLAITSLYGIDILADNVSACRERLFGIWRECYLVDYAKPFHGCIFAHYCD